MSGRNAINVINAGAKTINLAKDVLRKPPVCEEFRGPPASPPPLSAPSTRFCTPEQLRSICPPDPCKCEEKPVPLTKLEKFLKGSSFVLKILLVLGIIKWTDNLGIWGNTQTTANMLESAKKKLAPALGGDKKNAANPNGPTKPAHSISYKLASLWNKAVENVFYIIGVIPSNTFRKLFKSPKATKNKIDEEEDEIDTDDIANKQLAANNIKRFY